MDRTTKCELIEVPQRVDAGVGLKKFGPSPAVTAGSPAVSPRKCRRPRVVLTALMNASQSARLRQCLLSCHTRWNKASRLLRVESCSYVTSTCEGLQIQ